MKLTKRYAFLVIGNVGNFQMAQETALRFLRILRGLLFPHIVPRFPTTSDYSVAYSTTLLLCKHRPLWYWMGNKSCARHEIRVGIMKDLTIKCSNKNCNKEYVSELKKCPFCGEPNPNYDGDDIGKSFWYSFASLILLISFLSLIVSIYYSIKLEDIYIFIVGFISFVGIALSCAVVQLLAGIKEGIDELNNK